MFPLKMVAHYPSICSPIKQTWWSWSFRVGPPRVLNNTYVTIHRQAAAVIDERIGTTNTPLTTLINTQFYSFVVVNLSIK